MVHDVPFHRSARLVATLVVLRESPTAVHAVVAVHDTPERKLFIAPLGLGVDWIAQPAAGAASTGAGSNTHATDAA